MKNVRIIFSKTDRMKFVSHLDLNRYFIRLFRMAEIPIWYTEGFNQHPYISFALPLSLGYESVYEICDFKITDDDYSLDDIKDKLNKYSVRGIEIIDCIEPIQKAKSIVWSVYKIFLFNSDDADEFVRFLSSGEIITEKKTKKGGVKEIEIAQHIKGIEVKTENDQTVILLTLPSGNELTINPELYISKFEEIYNKSLDNNVLRISVLDGAMKVFR